MFEVGIGVGMIIIAMAIAKRIMAGPQQPAYRAPRHVAAAPAPVVTQTVSSVDRQKALEVYQKLAHEKLEVIKTALAMGYSQEDLARLDARLERLIGKEQLQQLAVGNVPMPSADMANHSLEDELRELRTARASR
jgi:hypothetical protein